MSERDPEPWDKAIARRVNTIESMTSMKDKPELEVLISIFYMVFLIKDKLDLILK